MRTKHLTLTATLALTLGLGACSTAQEGPTTDSPGSTATDTTNDAGATGTAGADDAASSSDAGDATSAAMSDPVCAGFFQNVPVTLADRADKDRTMLTEGTVTDPATFGEVNLLSQRIRDLAAGAEGDQAALLERINAPFVEASDVVLDDPELSPSDPEISLPTIQVDDSAAAQEELLASCQG